MDFSQLISAEKHQRGFDCRRNHGEFFFGCTRYNLHRIPSKRKKINWQILYYANLLGRFDDDLKKNNSWPSRKLSSTRRRVHKWVVTLAKLKRKAYNSLPHLPYSPNLASSDFVLLPNLKKRLRGERFDHNDEIIAQKTLILRILTNQLFGRGQKIRETLEKVNGAQRRPRRGINRFFVEKTVFHSQSVFPRIISKFGSG